MLPQNLDFTQLDQLAIEDRLKRLIAKLWPEWSDTERADIGNILIRMLAPIGDDLNFYQGAQARESRLTTARLRSSILAFAKDRGYRPSTAQPPQAVVLLSIPAPLAGDVIVPAGRRISTAEVTAPVAYQLLLDATIPAGSTSVSALAENSVTYSEAFTSTDLESQAYRLKATGYIDHSITVLAADGTYTEVEDLLDSRATDQHYTVTVDERGRGLLEFGDGITGRIPSGTITVVYRTGAGTAGRVEAGRLKLLEGTYTDSFGTVAQISVTNPDASTPGGDRETNEQIKRNAPRALRTLSVLVGREDYEIAAERTAGVARALHLPDALAPNAGLLCTVPTDLGTPSQTLLDAVAAQWAPGGSFKKLNTYRVTPIASPYLDVDVFAVVTLLARTSRPAARAAIAAALANLFALEITDPSTKELIRNPNVDFGYYLAERSADGDPSFAWSDVFNAVRDAAGVRGIDPGASSFLLNGERANVPLLPQQFPRLGSVTLIDAADGTSF